MYIHLYTIEESATSNTLRLYWYPTPEKDKELFEDFQQIFTHLRIFNRIHAFTAQVVRIDSEVQHRERMTLLGLETAPSIEIKLQGQPTPILCNHHLVTDIPRFKKYFPLFSKPFTPLIYSTSKMACPKDSGIIIPRFKPLEDKESVSVAPKTQSIEDILDILKTNPDTDLIALQIFNKLVVAPKFDLKRVSYTPITSSLCNFDLNMWYLAFIKNNDYDFGCEALMKLAEIPVQTVAPVPPPVLPSALPSAPPSTEQPLAVETAAVTPQEPIEESDSASTAPPSSSVERDWADAFLELYLEKDLTSDILLSSIYQDYVETTAACDPSKVLTMHAFTKILRTHEKFKIVRRSKGMVLLGYRSLVGQQATFFEKARNGELYERQLLKTPELFESIVAYMKGLKEGVAECFPLYPYAREVEILLRCIDFPVKREIVIQHYCSISTLKGKTFLGEFSWFIDNFDLKDPFSLKNYQAFQFLTRSCILYYPFNLAHLSNNTENLNIIQNKYNFNETPSKKEGLDADVSPLTYQFDISLKSKLEKKIVRDKTVFNISESYVEDDSWKEGFFSKKEEPFEVEANEENAADFFKNQYLPVA